MNDSSSPEPAPLVLEPPAAVAPVEPEQAGAVVPLEAGRRAELAERASTFVSGLTGLDPRDPDFAARVKDVSAMGRDDIRAAASVTSRMLERPVAALEAAQGRGTETDPQRRVATSLVELRLTVEELDPAKAADGGFGKFLRDLLPFRKQLQSYFARYVSAQGQLDRIIRALQSGSDTLLKDNAAVEGEKARLWETMTKLQEYATLTAALDTALVDEIARIRAVDPEKADAFTSDVLFEVRQKHQDLLTQLAVSAQGYMALDVVRKNNAELVKGVERATTTTVSALRTAVIVAQALANQKLVLDQIDALSSTTSNIIVATSEMLKQNSARVAEQATNPSVSVQALETAFTNIYETIDAVDGYKAKAVETMGQTVTALRQRLDEASAYLERAKPEGQA
ncbi:toxic anion resistance protein [Myceligenerans pegani]|uniref:Toxic anion resistance protein n=1 Tax=Myceligenerans pegani TaxID=2776917 RepID=A0ABR9MWI1_9MICO|nr:toxic anion resistance protein [Myceligenerans sp. TRM 65318]MBE1875746.1 toxic anion resistance protein [Myceligenerans sp. TRM 65318]MBE3018017.1 toxic anion resistance protein [Myceligenerans sp. TRM 65318]